MIMTYAKLIDGAPRIMLGAHNIANATEAQLAEYAAAHGYKPYRPTPAPETPAHHGYAETAEEITDTWTPYTAAELAPLRAAELREKLAATDYVAAKLAEVDGAARTALLAEYADTLAARRAWRAEINKLEQ